MQFAYLGAAGAQLPELVEVDSSTVTNTASTTITFSSMNFGEPAADRYILVAIINTDAIANTNTLTGITIAGETPGLSVSNGSSHGTADAVDINTGFAWLLHPTGASGDIVATFSATLATSGVTMCRVFSIYAPSGLSSSAQPVDTAPDTSGNMAAAAPDVSKDLVLIITAYEGAGGQTITSAHGSNIQTTFWQGELGTATHGFAGKVFVSLNKSASTITASVDAYTSGDSGVIHGLAFLTH